MAAQLASVFNFLEQFDSVDQIVIWRLAFEGQKGSLDELALMIFLPIHCIEMDAFNGP